MSTTSDRPAIFNRRPELEGKRSVPLRHQIAQDKVRASVSDKMQHAQGTSPLATGLKVKADLALRMIQINKAGSVFHDRGMNAAREILARGGEQAAYLKAQAKALAPSAKDQMHHAQGTTSPMAAKAGAADRAAMGHPKASQSTQTGPRSGTYYVSPGGTKIYK